MARPLVFPDSLPPPADAAVRAFADDVPAMLWITAADGRCVYLSRDWYRFTGQQEPAANGFAWLASVHAEDRDAVGRAFLAANEAQVPFQFDYRLRRHDGVYRWVLSTGRPRSDPSGAFIGFAGIVIDVHGRKEARLAYQASEERYRAFIETSSEGIWRLEFEPPFATTLSVDEQIDCAYEVGRFAECNEVMARMYGLASSHELVGQRLDRMLPLEAPTTRPFLAMVIEAGYRVTDVESVEFDASGAPVHFSNSMVGIVEDGRLVRLWGTQRDITRQKMAEDALRRSEEALKESNVRKDEFLAMLAHELRNPLAPIRNGLQVMRMAADRPEVVAQAREIMERQLQQMVRIVDDLLDVSRITRGVLALRQEVVDLSTVLDSAVETSMPAIAAAGHRFRYAAPAPGVRLSADPARLAQVFANLLNNAAKFTPAGGEIRLEAQSHPDEVVVAVIDDGPGIPASMLERVFEMFTQVDETLGKQHGGLGIGLTVARRLVEMHGGTIEATSAGPGLGSAFVVRLPRLPAG